MEVGQGPNWGCSANEKKNVNYSMLYEGDGLGLNICECYSWEVTLIIGLDVSFSSI
jgi:hypothetical protein